MTRSHRSHLQQLLREAEPELLVRDVRRLRGKARRVRGDTRPLMQELQAARQRAEQRQQRIPLRIDYPPELPVSAARTELLDAIRTHQVLVVCGDTGSGKSTQLPKLCLEAGRGRRGMIAHTQPRRVAARALAGRIADEMQTPLGDLVGFETRFEKQLAEDGGLIKLMTDGILLNELSRDRDLAAYDTIIIDEAHERSLNIDFLLGYLKRLLPRRPELKLIITSATLDPESLSRHFDGAPVHHVEGRSYPVTVHYRPPTENADPAEAVADAIDAVWGARPDGDALVFLPGEREIRDAARVLRGRRKDAEVLPLYARLGSRAQDAVFRKAPRPRVVLATNVAETSLTVPGIRYVVDTGTARVARFQPRSGVQSLKIEAISQAAAAQRAGRCGRVGPGICIRLYSEDDFQRRPAFTDPEIRRANLAGVILQMAALKLGAVVDFPWLDAPEQRHLREGERLLRELGALDDSGSLTRTGQQLARLPLDPRMARIALAAKGHVAEDAALILAAALAVADPHEQPPDQRDVAKSAHGQWRHPRSDFLTLLNLWDRTRALRRDEGTAALRRWCEKHFVSFNRLREWGLVVTQLRQALGVRAAADRPLDDAGRAQALKQLYAPLHQALLAGLVDHIGMRQPEKNGYQGPRGRQFEIFPGSGVARKAPPWVMCAELAQTRKLFARTVAGIEPAWLEEVAPHLVRRTLEHPEFNAKRGEVSATEVVRFHGLTLSSRARHYGSQHPEEARAIFIREALVRGALRNPPAFLRDNLALVEAVREKEARMRRPDLLADEDQLFAFYDARLPAEVCTQAALERWLKRSGQSERRARGDSPLAALKQQLSTRGPLHMREPDVLRPGADADVEALFPEVIDVNGHTIALEYRHDPGAEADGVTFILDLPALFALPASRFDWLVRGLRPALFEALLRSLPKKLRGRITPAAHYADALTERLGPGDGPLLEAIGHALQAMCSVQVRPEDFDRERLPPHLCPRLRLLDAQGAMLGEADSLEALRARFGALARSAVAEAASGSEWVRDHLRDWDFDALPEKVTLPNGLPAYPALVAEGNQVHLRPFESREAADQAHAEGCRQLLLNAVGSRARDVAKTVSKRFGLQLATTAHRPETLAQAVVRRCADEIFEPPAIRSRAAFEAAVARRTDFSLRAQQVMDDLADWFGRAVRLRGRLKELQRAFPEAIGDARAQLDSLLAEDCVDTIPSAHWARVTIYLQALERRLERLANKPQRDAQCQQQIHAVRGKEALPLNASARWIEEEWRVALFAQELKAQGGPSAATLQRALSASAAQSAR